MQNLEPLDSRRGKLWQSATGVALCVCIAAEYFHYNAFTTTTRLIKDYLGEGHSDDEDENDKFGQFWFAILLVTMETFWMLGKVVFGLTIDTVFKSGLIPIVLTMTVPGSLLLLWSFIDFVDPTMRIALSLIWIAILSFFSSPYWGSAMRMVSNWYPYYQHGRWTLLLGFMVEVGDAVVRVMLSAVIDRYPENWRPIFRFCGVACLLVAIPLVLVLRDKPTSKGLQMAEENPFTNLFDNSEADKHRKRLEQCVTGDTTNVDDRGDKHDKHDTSSGLQPMSIMSHQSENVYQDLKQMKLAQIWQLLKPVLIQPYFWMLAIAAFCNYAVVVLTWTYQVEYFEYITTMSHSEATLWSGLTPLAGIPMMPLIGCWMDKVRAPHWRVIVLPISAAINALGFFALNVLDLSKDESEPYGYVEKEYVIGASLLIALTAVTGYYLPSGVLGIELGGQAASALVCSLIDFFGAIGIVVLTLASGFFDFRWLFICGTILGVVATIDGIAIFAYKWAHAKYGKDAKNMSLLPETTARSASSGYDSTYVE